MAPSDAPATRKTPLMISAFTQGFNTVATHIWLILLPVGMDVLLLFGPRLRVKSLFQPVIQEMANSFSAVRSTNMADMITSMKELWGVVLDHYNLFSSLRTFPIGIPSLMASIGPLQHPLGMPFFWELDSAGNFLSLWVIMALLGLLLGSMYFSVIAQTVKGEKIRISVGEIGWQTLQSLLLTLALFTIIAFLIVPLIFILSILAMVSGFLAQLAVLFFMLILIWIITPLIFSPHGIFTSHLNVLVSILNSVRLVRFFLPGTGLFILMAILINEGLNTLWRVPDEASWLVLVGIVGHAFISTSLLASSYVYYQYGMEKMQTSLAAMQASSTSSGGN